MPRQEPCKITLDGRTYNATWHIEGKEVVVSSAYGSEMAAVGRSKPELVAERLLRGLVEKRLG